MSVMKCLSWFESYLSNRTQRVSLNNNLSDVSDVIYGVPQGGSILGPLLFLIFINDVVHTKHFHLCRYICW